MMVHLLRNSKLRRRSGAPNVDGWMAINTEFRRWIVEVQELGCDIILIAHQKEIEDGGRSFFRLDVPSAGCRQEIYQETDLMAYVSMGDDGAVLNFSPTPYHHGKNPPQWDPILAPRQVWADGQDGKRLAVRESDNVPDDTMARLLADAKAKMSRGGAPQQAAPAPQAAAPAAQPAAPTPTAPQAPAPAQSEPATPHTPAAAQDAIGAQLNAELDALLAETPEAGSPAEVDLKNRKLAHWQKAEALGYVFDPSTGRYLPKAS